MAKLPINAVNFFLAKHIYVSKARLRGCLHRNHNYIELSPKKLGVTLFQNFGGVSRLLLHNDINIKIYPIDWSQFKKTMLIKFLCWKMISSLKDFAVHSVIKKVSVKQKYRKQKWEDYSLSCMTRSTRSTNSYVWLYRAIQHFWAT